MRFNEEQVKCAIEIILGKIEPHINWWLTITIELARYYQLEAIVKLSNGGAKQLLFSNNNCEIANMRPKVAAFPFPDFIYELMPYLDAQSLLNLRAVSRQTNAAVLYYARAMVQIIRETAAMYNCAFSARQDGPNWIISATHADGHADIFLRGANIFAIGTIAREFLLQVYMGRVNICICITDTSGNIPSFGNISRGRIVFESTGISDSGVSTCSPFCMPDGDVKIQNAGEISYCGQRVLFVPVGKYKDAKTRVRAISGFNEYDLDICYRRYSDINIGALFAEIISIVDGDNSASASCD